MINISGVRKWPCNIRIDTNVPTCASVYIHPLYTCGSWASWERGRVSSLASSFSGCSTSCLTDCPYSRHESLFTHLRPGVVFQWTGSLLVQVNAWHLFDPNHLLNHIPRNKIRWNLNQNISMFSKYILKYQPFWQGKTPNGITNHQSRNTTTTQDEYC